MEIKERNEKVPGRRKEHVPKLEEEKKKRKKIAEAQFQPSLHGFIFSNQWRDYPGYHYSIQVPPWPKISFTTGSTTSLGLCGGMSFAARDFYETKSGNPRVDKPSADSPLYRYIRDRQADSVVYNNFEAVGKFLALMNPALPDHDTWVARGRAWKTIKEEWPKIKGDLDRDSRLCCLGLVLVKTYDLEKISDNHQVLAYGYDLDGDLNLNIYVYDPNYPNIDSMHLHLNISNPRHTTEMSLYKGSMYVKKIYAFFQLHYEYPRIPFDQYQEHENSDLREKAKLANNSADDNNRNVTN
jgi:hypothetical protein